MEAVEEKINPPQHQYVQPGLEADMEPQPRYIEAEYSGSDKLKGKVAIITGGDSGIGRAVAVHFAAEGADVAIVYLDEHEDAEKTKQLVESYGSHCLLIPGDVAEEQFCEQAVHETLQAFGKLDIVISITPPNSFRKPALWKSPSVSLSIRSGPIFSPCFIWSRRPCLTCRIKAILSIRLRSRLTGAALNCWTTPPQKGLWCRLRAPYRNSWCIRIFT